MTRSQRARFLKIMNRNGGAHYASQVKQQLRVNVDELEEIAESLWQEGLIEEPYCRGRGFRFTLTTEGVFESCS